MSSSSGVGRFFGYGKRTLKTLMTDSQDGVDASSLFKADVFSIPSTQAPEYNEGFFMCWLL